MVIRRFLLIFSAVLMASVFTMPRCFAYGGLEVNEPILPIIMYHEVKTYKTGKDVIMPWEFESDLKFLKENGYTTITMSDLIGYVYHDASLPEKPIILSFDDGYLNNYVYVLPLLKKYDMKIVFSIIGKSTDDFSDINDDNLDYSHVTWDQLNEMIGSGYVEVQNHTYNLHKYCRGRIGCGQAANESPAEYEKLLIEDIGGFQEQISEITGQTPTTFTYPYGKCSDSMNVVLKKLGFKASLSCDYGVNIISKNPDDLFCLKRICRSHNRPVGKLIAEAMKTLKLDELNKQSVAEKKLQGSYKAYIF